MTVLDASVLVEWLLRTDLGERAVPQIRGRTRQSPDIVDLDVTNALRGLARRGDVAVAQAGAAVARLPRLPLTRHASIDLSLRAWELRGTHSACNAAYVTLAERLDAPLLTADARLARSHGHRAAILGLD